MKVWILIFVCMFSMPLLVAGLYFKMKKGQILKIRQDYVKDARYFGKSFSALVEEALPEMKNGMIMLSRQEKVLEADGNREFAQPDIEELVVDAPEKSVVQTEVLCKIQEILLFFGKSALDGIPQSESHELLRNFVFAEHQIGKRRFRYRDFRKSVHFLISFFRHCGASDSRTVPDFIVRPGFIPFDVRHHSSDKYLISNGVITVLKRAAWETMV